MPIYTVHNYNTGETYDVFLKLAEREEFFENNPNIKQLISAPSIIGGVTKHNVGGFGEVLSKIGEAHPASPLGDSHGNKSLKRRKSEQIVRKHIDKQNKS